MANPWDDYSGRGDEPWDEYSDKESSIPLGMTRAGLQGMTFGGSDELGAGAAAALAHRGPVTQGLQMLTDPTNPESWQNESYGDIYDTMMGQLSGERQQFQEEHPYLSTGAEIVGGATTGIAGAGKLAASRIGQQVLPHVPKLLQAAGLGAVEGGLYGTLSSDPGSRVEGGLTGAAVGAVAAPVLGWGVDKVGHGAFTLSRWAKNKLTSTDRSSALRAIRRALSDEGLDPEDAVRIYESLGPEGTLMDVSSNMQVLTRAASDQSGSVRGRARSLIHDCMVSQGSRLLKYAERLMGNCAQ